MPAKRLKGGNRSAQPTQRLLKVDHVQGRTPFSIQVFTNKRPVTIVRLRLRTKQATVIHQIHSNLGFDRTSSHQIQKLNAISGPVAFLLFEGVQNFLCWCKNWFVDVANATKLPGEILKILCFGKARKLGGVIKSNVDELFRPRHFESVEKMLG